MIFLDTNILLELILAGRPRYTEVKQFLQGTTEETAISALTVHLVMHFGRKEQAEDAFLHAVLSENRILPLTSEDYQWAVDNEQGKDFEDAIQIAVAIRTSCSPLVTLDANLAKRYAKLPIELVIPS